MSATRIGAIFCSILAAMAVRARPATATPEIPSRPPDGYLVLPFENQSGVTSLEWMEAALPVALAEKLEAHPGLRPVYGPLVLPEVPWPSDAAGQATAGGGTPLAPEAIARQAAPAGARFVFSGRFRRPDWKLELTLQIWSVEGGAATLVAERTGRGELAKTFAILDGLALELLAQAGRPAPAAVADKIGRQPTRDFYAFTLYGRGLVALHGMGRAPDLAKAERDLGRTVFIDPRFAEAHRMLALLFERRGQLAKARGQRTYALDLRPDYYAPLAGLVRDAHAARERPEGIELAARALAIRPWDLEVRYLLGEMLWEEGRIDDAHLELRRVVAARADHLAARRVLVLIHATKGASDDLADELEQILALDPTDESARLDLGAAYAALGRTEDAIAAYLAVAERNPRQVLALKLLGDMHRARGDLAGAVRYYERALAANRNDPRPYFLLGAAYTEAGQAQKAIRIYLRAQRFPRYAAEVLNNLGALYLRRGDPQALWYLGQAAKRRPSNPRVHYNYALALDQAHKRDRAIEEIELAGRLDPADPEIQFARGALLLKVGRLEDAERAFQDTAKLDPGHEDALHNLRLIDELRRKAREGEVRVE